VKPTLFLLTNKSPTIERKIPNATGRTKHRMMFSCFVPDGSGRVKRWHVGAIRKTHDGVFTKNDPVLSEQSTKLAKE